MIGPSSSVLSDDLARTARLTAAARAVESARADRLFADPFAGLFAGPLTDELLEATPTREWCLGIAARTRILDELLLLAIGGGEVEVVLSLGAGFDVRPYRLALPASLRWIEADFAPVLEEKAAALAGADPACEVARIAADLGEASGRRALLAHPLVGSRSLLVLSEGLVVYLEPGSLAELAGDLAGAPGALYWLLDIATPSGVAGLDLVLRAFLGEARLRFGPPEGAAFFRPFGWEVVEERHHGDEAARLCREPASAWMARHLGSDARWEAFRARSPRMVLLRRLRR